MSDLKKNRYKATLLQLTIAGDERGCLGNSILQTFWKTFDFEDFKQ
jgi:hypothetical protein